MSRHEDTPADSPEQGRWADLLRNAALGAAVLGLVWVAFNVELPSVRELQSTIESLGWGAWIAFVALYAVVATTPIPVTVMAVTGGLLFNLPVGTALSVAGVMLGCWGAYWGARGLGRQTMVKWLGRHGPMVERNLDQSGFEAVMILRLMPGAPYWPVNYGSGAFGVPHGVYLSASLLSCIPGQFSLVAVGAFIADPGVITGAAVGVGWAAVIVLTWLAYRRWKQTRPAAEA